MDDGYINTEDFEFSSFVVYLSTTQFFGGAIGKPEPGNDPGSYIEWKESAERYQRSRVPSKR